MARYLEFGLVLLAMLLQNTVVMSTKNNRPFDPSKLRVVSIEVEPYLMEIGPNGHQKYYTGYIKELLDLIIHRLDVRYELYMVPDGEYGYLKDKTTWSGMIKELIDNNADLAAAPLHRTYPRSHVVDFTRSILNVSATMLIKKPPNGIPDIQTPEDLLNSPHIQVGTLKSGTIQRAFKTSSDSTIIDLWHKIRHLTSSNAEGINQVRISNGKYVYILPSDIAEYNAGELPCELMAVSHFFPRGLVFAVQKDSVLLPQLNKVIYELEAQGHMHRLYTKYWLKDRPCSRFTYPSPDYSHLRTKNSSPKTKTISYILILSTLCIFRVFTLYEMQTFILL